MQTTEIILFSWNILYKRSLVPEKFQPFYDPSIFNWEERDKLIFSRLEEQIKKNAIIGLQEVDNDTWMKVKKNSKDKQK
jgi:hypothetical protein